VTVAVALGVAVGVGVVVGAMKVLQALIKSPNSNTNIRPVNE